MSYVTLHDLPIPAIPGRVALKQPQPKGPAEDRIPTRFHKLQTRSSDDRTRRIRKAEEAARKAQCLSSDYEQQRFQMDLQAVDLRIDPCVVREKLFWNMQSLRMDRSLIHGWGLFTTRPVPANEPVIEYTGELIRLAIVDKRQELYETLGNMGSYIFRLEGGDVYIDATITGGPAKYVNHSCEPNCTTKVVQFDGKPHVVIYSLRDIEVGEELSYDYKLDYEPKEKRITCMCGSKRCKGWLNWSDKHDIEEKTFLQLYEVMKKRQEEDAAMERERQATMEQESPHPSQGPGEQTQ